MTRPEPPSEKVPQLMTQTRLMELLDYDPDTGIFINKVTRRNATMGSTVGWMNKPGGYLRARVEGKVYMLHRLAWLYVHGNLPLIHIDHIDGDKLNNRIANLRLASRSENLRNRGKQSDNTSGWCGVSLNKDTGTFKAFITLENYAYHLGLYRSPEIAAAVYAYVCQQIHGEFAKPYLPNWLIPDSLDTLSQIGGNMRQVRKALAGAAIRKAMLRSQTVD